MGAAVSFAAAIFDMDGVVTRTARLHAAAWKQLFDEFLASRSHGLAPFDEVDDYLAYVDGKPRLEGVRSFLRARGFDLPEHEVRALAERKNALFERRLEQAGVETFPSTLALIERLRAEGVRTGVVTSSRHGREVLEAARIGSLFDARVDGNDLHELGLKGKPDPDGFYHCAELLGVAPARSLLFEDAVSGVQAGNRGRFGLVVGVDRGGNARALERAGADVVVADLAELDIPQLRALYERHRENLAWRVEQDGLDPAREPAMESLFAVGNGALGVRGALDVPLPGSQGDLFVAGVYDRKRAHLPYSEIEFLAPERGDDPHAELVPLPFPFRLRASFGGEPLEVSGEHWRFLERSLDLRCGMLGLEIRYELPGVGRAVLRTRRCASAADAHLLLHEATLEAPPGECALEATLEEPQLGARHPHLERLEHARIDDVELVRYATLASRVEICIACRTEHNGRRLRRFVAVHTSRDGPNPRAAALAHLRGLESFERLLEAHAAKWREFWQAADIRVHGRPATEQALRFLAYHLRSTATHDPRVSVPARALTGRAYEGHIFWDAEIFMLPFYLHVDPAQARSLLLFRHRTLEGARRRARQLGYRGACYAWESDIEGDDVTPTEILLRSSGKAIPIFTGTQQVHVTADIAYAVWRYWEATRDEAFLAGPGAEILFETARFWTSRATRGERQWHIREVVGPDEYHHAVNDNAYTNWMARYNLERAAELARLLDRNTQEGGEWAALAASLYCPGPDERGVIEQFEGFHELGDYPLPKEERFKAPISRLFDWDKINRLKIIKQADVLMLPLLFPDAFTEEVVAANYRYYEPLTDHGSSLSPPIHAAIAARLGLKEDAERYWRQALWLDLSNAMDNSALGVHPAAMGGTWQALVFGFLGVRFTEEGPQADRRAGERLPEDWSSVELSLEWRGRRHALRIERQGAGK